MPRLKIAAVVTEYRKFSHAQHILDRFLWGYNWQGRHHMPPMDLVALFTDQVPESDLSRSRAKEVPTMKIYPSVSDALTLGGSKLAVDGVLLIGEHGRYPKNEKGQTLYPRYELFQKIVDVFRSSGRSVPVFNDKHLSWNWEWAKKMVDASKELGFPFTAGSSLPTTWRCPPIDMPLGAEIEEMVCIAPGGMDGYDIHALEAMQCMAERRKGGETGVNWIHAVKGDAVYDVLKRGSWDAGGCDLDLFQACMCRSHKLTPVRKGFNHVLPELDDIPPLVQRPYVYRYQYTDGVRATMCLLEGLTHDFTFAARLKGRKAPLSTLMFLPPRGLVDYFSPLANSFETMVVTGKPHALIERTLLTTGVTAAGVESLYQGQVRLPTPHLSVEYQPNPESTFVRS